MAVSPPLNERRVVTVLSVDVVGSTRLVAGLDPDDAQDLLDAVFIRIQQSVGAEGGSVVSFTGDGALVVFGWPEASEHHADNACLAAWDIQTASASAEHPPVQLRVGLASGLAVVRKVEVGFVSRYDVIGEAVHRAAALQKHAAAGSVLLCESTRGLSRLELSVDPKDLDLGLRTGPVRCFALREAPRHSPSALLTVRHKYPVVGREHELERLRDLVSSDGETPLALSCIGEPGLGKSRLAAAASQFAMEQDRTVILHEIRELDRTTPFACARALIQAALGADSSVLQEAVADAFDWAGSPREDRSATLAVFDSAATSLERQRGEPASQTRIVRALAQILAQAGPSGPRLVILEDLHNLDPESLQVLIFLMRERTRHPLALLLTGRPEARERAEAIAPGIVMLERLSDDAIEQIVGLADDKSQLTGDAKREIVERTAGNPFLLTQFIEEPGFYSDERNNASLPKSVESLIHARLDRLGPEARGLAQSLSLLGESVEADIAVAAVGPEARPGAAAMSELEKLAFLHLPASGVIRFRHALIAAACASSVGRTRRREVHVAAVDALSARVTDLPDLYPRLAYHAVEGGRDDRAIEFYWSAARRARSLAASQSLIAMFPLALACCERLGRAGEARFVDLVLLAFETFHLQGEIDQIEPFLERAVEYAERQGRRDKVCVARCHQGIAAWYQGRFAEGEQIMRPAFEEAKALGHMPLRFAAQFILAQQLHNLARIDDAFGLIRELCDLLVGDLELARLGAMGLPASIAHSHAGYYILEQARYAEAETYLLKALSIAERGRDPYSESLARIGLGRCLLLMGRHEEALACLLSGHDLIERQGFDPALLNVAGLLATALARLGRPQEAIERAEARLAQGLLGRTGSYERHYFWCGYGEALIVGGKHEEGLSRIDAAIAIGRSTSNPCILVQSLSLKASLLKSLGRDPDVVSDLEAEVRELETLHGLRAPARAP
jgi:class 3 adenylate cyclase/tetratricopeptide (TPR) repeat protein